MTDQVDSEAIRHAELASWGRDLESFADLSRHKAAPR